MSFLPDSFYWAVKGPVVDMTIQAEENNLHIILVISDVLCVVYSFGLMERDVLVVTIHQDQGEDNNGSCNNDPSYFGYIHKSRLKRFVEQPMYGPKVGMIPIANTIGQKRDYLNNGYLVNNTQLEKESLLVTLQNNLIDKTTIQKDYHDKRSELEKRQVIFEKV